MKIDPNNYGIREGINEVIVTTVSIDGKSNAAPIGIINRDDKLTVRVYNESQTCINIRDTGLLAANIVDDPVLFVQSALGDLDDTVFENIEAQNNTRFPVLIHSSAWILFKADYNEGRTALTAELHPITGKIKNPGVRAVNRGFNAVIEAVIQATRFNVFKKEKYINDIKSYNEIIKKCGGSPEKEAYKIIYKWLQNK